MIHSWLESYKLNSSVDLITACMILYIVREMMTEGLLRFLVVSSLSVICTIGVMCSFAMNAETKQMVREKIVRKVFRRFR